MSTNEKYLGEARDNIHKLIKSRSEKETEELLCKKSGAIIDSLADLNVAEKYRIISSLFFSLEDTIKSEGGTIEEDLKKFSFIGNNIERIKEEYEKNPFFRQAVSAYNQLLEEPKYSVAELEKIISKLKETDSLASYLMKKNDFLEILKDKNKVEKILNE